VNLGKKNSISLTPGTMDAADWESLRSECEKDGGKVVFDVVKLHRWPEASRFDFLSLASGLGKSCKVQIDGKPFTDAFDAVLAAMKGPKSMDAHRQGLRAAIEAAALLHGDMPDTTAKRINERLAEVGGAKVNHASLVKQIRNLAGGARPSADACTAAQQYLDHRRKACEAAEGQPVLRYYQSDFYVWQGKAWKRQEDKNFEAQVMQFLQTLEIPKLTARFAKDVIAHLAAMANLKCWDAPMPFLVANEDPSEIRHPHLIVFNNGMIDMDKVIAGTAPKIKPVDIAFFNEVVLPYDFSSKAKCPLWLQTLNDILPKTGKSDHRRLLLQEFMGYSLLLDCRFQKMMIMIGEGGNGKTTVTEVWEAVLGNDNVSDVPLEALGAEYRLWSLKGKLANFSGELQYLGKMHEGLVKRVVSGETTETNRKHKPPAKFRPTAKLIVNTNDLPQIQDPTQGTWDRLFTMPFEVRIRGTEKEDKGRVEKLREELPGVFNWAVEGLRRLLKQGHFTHCQKCQALLDQHRQESDTARLFVSACCEKQPGWVTFSVPLYQFYAHYCRVTGRKAVAETEFGRRLKRLKWLKRREESGQRRPVYKDMCLSKTGLLYREQALERPECSRPISQHGSHTQN
jgi:P4 family phage/plasmid primase-like protien